MADVKNIPIILIILVLSLVLGYIISFVYRLLKTNVKVMAIVIGLIMIAGASYRLYQLNTQDNDGFLSIGKAMEVFFYGTVGGGLVVSTIV